MKFVHVKNFNSTEVFWYTRMTTVSLFWYTNFGPRGITWTGSTCIPWKGSHCLVWTFVNPVFATKHGNSIAKGCKLLFGLVARETWLRLLRHVYNFSCYGLLSVPYNFSLWQKKVLWGIHVSETKQTVFLFAPLIIIWFILLSGITIHLWCTSRLRILIYRHFTLILWWTQLHIDMLSRYFIYICICFWVVDNTSLSNVVHLSVKTSCHCLFICHTQT